MLNPSTADENVLDSTVKRCCDFARRWGYGRLLVGNIFAFRSTDRSVLRRVKDPIGPDNDAALREIANEAALVVGAWGTFGELRRRGEAVLALLAELDVEPHGLELNRDGTPKHPLYVPARWVPKRLRDLRKSRGV